MSKHKTRTPLMKAKRKDALMRNERARYEKLIKDNPTHKDRPVWDKKLASL